MQQEDVVLENQTQYRVEVRSAEEKEQLMKDIFHIPNIGQVIVFCNRKYTVTHVTGLLSSIGITVGCISADLLQNERELTMDQFRKGIIKVLVATDVIARGIDTEVHLVINYDVPSDIEQYVHRIGRTGRFGKHGSAINIVTPDEQRQMHAIISFYKIKMYDYKMFIQKATNAIEN